MENRRKIAVLTGGSRGLGRDMVLNLSKNGIDVIFSYNSNKEMADATVKDAGLYGSKVLALQLDTTQPDSFDSFITRITSHLQENTGSPNFDFLINNAGTALYAPFEETTEEQLDEMINIHYKAVFLLTQKSLPFINSGGRIINISSGLARFAFNGSSCYASMKGAVEVLTRYLAKELGPKGISANVVAPGAIETDFGGGRTRDDQEINARIAGLTALGRVGLPEDIGGVIAFLCSDAARWINGQRIEVSGGMMV